MYIRNGVFSIVMNSCMHWASTYLTTEYCGVLQINVSCSFVVYSVPAMSTLLATYVCTL